MNLQLINGNFSAADATEILSKMVSAKIRFHEEKIHGGLNEEDIKTREKRIKELQKELAAIRNFIATKNATIEMNAVVEIM